DERAVARVAEPIEEEDRQRQLIGRIEFRGGLTDKGGRTQDRFLVRHIAALQQRQRRQGGVGGQVRLVGRPGAGGLLLRPQIGSARLDRLVDALLFRQRQVPRVRTQR